MALVSFPAGVMSEQDMQAVTLGHAAVEMLAAADVDTVQGMLVLANAMGLWLQGCALNTEQRKTVVEGATKMALAIGKGPPG
jgi:hypothetical protein